MVHTVLTEMTSTAAISFVVSSSPRARQHLGLADRQINLNPLRIGSS